MRVSQKDNMPGCPAVFGGDMIHVHRLSKDFLHSAFPSKQRTVVHEDSYYANPEEQVGPLDQLDPLKAVTSVFKQWG